MLNQVTIEGFIVSQWCYKGDTFLRIAHHRPRRKNEIIHSDYITVKAGKNAKTGTNLQQGDLVRVNGIQARTFMKKKGGGGSLLSVAGVAGGGCLLVIITIVILIVSFGVLGSQL